MYPDVTLVDNDIANFIVPHSDDNRNLEVLLHFFFKIVKCSLLRHSANFVLLFMFYICLSRLKAAYAQNSHIVFFPNDIKNILFFFNV